MPRANYLMTAACYKELPELLFDVLATKILVNLAPITWSRFLPMVEILREKLKNHRGDD